MNDKKFIEELKFKREEYGVSQKRLAVDVKGRKYFIFILAFSTFHSLYGVERKSFEYWLHFPYFSTRYIGKMIFFFRVL